MSDVISGRREGRRVLRADARRSPLPGSPLGYYADVVRSRWFYLVGAAVVGGLVAGLAVAFWPAKVTATTTLQLSVVATDPSRVNGPPSSRIDRGTEEELGRSAVVAQAAAADLAGDLTPVEVAEATTLVVGSESAVVRVLFRHPDAAVAVAGADAVAQSYLALRLDGMRLQVEDHLERIRERVAVIEGEIAALDTAGGAAADEVSTLRSQALTDELAALVQQRAALVGLAADGGRVISAASLESVSGRPWVPGIVTGIVVGLLVGLAAAFARRRGPRQLSGRAEVADLTGRPVWAAAPHLVAADRWRVAGRLVLNATPEFCADVVVTALSTSADTSRVVRALREAGAAARPALRITSVQVSGRADLAAHIETLSAADAVVLLVDPRQSARSVLTEVLEVLSELDVVLVGSLWRTPGEPARTSAAKGSP